MSYIINLNDTDPAPDAGYALVKWKKNPVSAGTDPTTGEPYFNVSAEYVNANGFGGVQVKTANYTAIAGDSGTLLVFNSSSAIQLTLPATPPGALWIIGVQNIGAGLLTINRSGLLIDNVAANLTVPQNNGLLIFTDNTNYFTERGMSPDITGLATKVGIQDQSYIYAPDTGSANAYAVALTPTPTLITGSVVVFKAANANTAASTLAVNGGSAIPIKKSGTLPLVGGEIQLGQFVTVVYDATVPAFQLMGSAGSIGGGNMTYLGAWSLSSNYSTGAVVLYNGALYLRLTTGPGSGTAAVVQSGGAMATATIPFGSNVTAGNLLVVTVFQQGGAPTAPTDTQGNTYTLAAQHVSGTDNAIAIYWAIAGSTGANSVHASGAVFSGALYSELLNVHSTINATAQDYTSVTPSTVSITTTTSGCFLFSACGNPHNAATFTAIGGTTVLAQANGNDAMVTGSASLLTPGSTSVGFNIGGGVSVANCPIACAAFTTTYVTPDFDPTNWMAFSAGAATATSSTLGVVKPDNTTITIAGGILSAVGGGGGGALILLEQHTASSSAELDFTSSITATYDEYLIEIIGLKAATNAAAPLLQFSTNGGTSYDTSGIYDWGQVNNSLGGTSVGGNGQSNHGGIIIFADASGNGLLSTATPGLACGLKLYAPLDASNFKFVDGRGIAQYSGNSNRFIFTMGGVYKSTTAVNAFRIIMSSGNITSGIVRCYGLTH